MLFALLRDRCGLSQTDAADLLNVRLDTVKSWERRTNPNRAPEGVIAALRALYRAMERAADEAVRLHRRSRATEVTLYTGGRRFAEWPGGSGLAVLGMVAARVDVPVTISPDAEAH